MGADNRPPMLPEDEAFEIAMAWIEELQCGLYLEAPRNDSSLSLVNSYEFVLFTTLESQETLTPGSPDALAKTKEKASLVRAAIITWYMLARCPGYTQENSKFWKTVFDEYQRDPNDTGEYEIDNRGVSECIGFFDEPGCSFPRVIITPTSNESLFRTSLYTVFGMPGYDMDAAIATKLQTLVARMSSYFIEPTGSRAVVEVGVGLGVMIEDTRGFTLPSLQRVLKEVELLPRQVTRTTSYTPCMKMIQVLLACSVTCSSIAQASELYELSQRLPLRFDREYDVWQVTESVPLAGKALWVSSILRLPNHNIQATMPSLTFPVNYKHDDLFQAVASALPFANTLHSVRLRTNRMAPRAFEDHDFVWIAYAIFHPNAVNSSWRHLIVASYQPSLRVTQVMTAMARGNNLLQLLHGSPADATSYVQGKLAPRTVVRMAPDAMSPTLLVTSASERVAVDVCGVNSARVAKWRSFVARVATWRSWVGVIVPAYGIGYVRPAQVHDIMECPASPSMLTGLTLLLDNDRASPDIILEHLLFLGARLEYLDVRTCGNLDSTTMGRIFQSCPSLRRLIVSHNGAYWSSVAANADLSTHPPLEELSLHVPHDPLSRFPIKAPGSAFVYEPCLEHLQSSLANLRVLLVRGDSPYLLGDSRMALAGILHHASQLSHVYAGKLRHDSNLTTLALGAGDQYIQSWDGPKTYQRQLARSEATLRNLALDTDQYRTRPTPLELARVLALLSLGTAASPTKLTALAQICGDRALSSRIIQFSSSIDTRTIYFEI